MPLTLDSAVTAIRRPRVSATDAALLRKLEIRTVRDLLLNLPHAVTRYSGRPISELRAGEEAQVIGTVESFSVRSAQHDRKMRIAVAVVSDDSGGRLAVTWFSRKPIWSTFKRGDRLAAVGIVKAPRYGRLLSLQPRHFERVAGDDEPHLVSELVPKYRLVKGLTLKKLAGWVDVALPCAGALVDPLPETIRKRHRLLQLEAAINAGHRPRDEAEWNAARRRMQFQELFELQVAFAAQRRRLDQETAEPIPYRQEVIDRFKCGLPFELTRAQRRAAWDVFKDVAREVPMVRLLNGDVGSGKTAVAAAAVAMAHAAGRQSVVRAPTEILARQHLGKFREYLEESFPDLTVELLVGGLRAPERRRVRMAAASGHCALLVGTHALIEEKVELPHLGLAVVDEQHRFGTRQRERLRAKGAGNPHFLAMTATPIPRTLALALYGEMALSVIDERPPGRTPVKTQVIVPGDRDRAYDLVRTEVGAGRQAFVICPLVEESEASQSRAATAEFDRLRRDVFPELRLSLVHGRLKDKDVVMRAFSDGASDVLVATSVVEVGVDVPNATVMLIEGAERFGLAQLHQFRGRVGRGAAAAHCLLLSDEAGEAAMERLRLLERTDDGFRLAEADMALRGAGELLGPRQHGMSDLAMRGLFDPELINEVRDEAEALLAEDPELARHPLLRSRLETLEVQFSTG